MIINGLTYETIIEHMRERVGQPKLPTSSTLGNSVSALKEFLRERGIGMTDVIGPTLRDDYRRLRDEHLAALRAAKRPAQFMKSRKWCLDHWHRLIRTLDHEGAQADEVPTPLQEKLRAFMQGRTYSRVARACGMNAFVLSGWCNGNVPRSNSAVKLARLEVYGDVEPGHLTDLLPFNVVGIEHRSSVGPVIGWRERNAKLSQDEFLLKRADAPPVVIAEWQRLVRYKISSATVITTGDKRTIGQRVKDRRVKGPQKKRGRNKTWKLEPVDASFDLDNLDPSRDWVDIVNGQFCSSAATNFDSNVASFFGWAVLSKERGGLELKAERLTFGLFTDDEAVEAFIDWKIQRAGNINAGTTNFLTFLGMLVHQEDGFLLRQAESIRRLDWELRVRRDGFAGQFDPADWIARCANIRDWVRTEQLILKEEGIVKSRDPMKAVQGILGLPVPMAAITQAIRRMAMDMPPSLKMQATHMRNLTLLAISASNPLRAKQLKGLTYFADNSGKLYQNSKGEWRIRIDKIEFKNFNGAAHDQDYDQAVAPEAWPYIARYLKEFRPVLGGTRPELLFVSRKTPSKRWDQLNTAFYTITKKYVSHARGFGPHSMRHIYATTVIIKLGRTMAALGVAASGLHDMPVTVERHYVHLLNHVGDRARQAAMGDVLSEMAVRPRNWKGPSSATQPNVSP